MDRLETDPKSAANPDFINESTQIIRGHLMENQGVLRESHEKLRRLQDELDLQDQKREEYERILLEKDSAYDDLLGKSLNTTRRFCSGAHC